MAKVKVLVVGGGASGGSAYNSDFAGGGGGAGGYVYDASFNVTKQNYNVVVGAGGTKSVNPSPGRNGNPSSFSTITANGGGAGGRGGGGTNGGSGGGGSSSYETSYSGGTGNQGGNGGSGIGTVRNTSRSAGGGGGGAGGNGSDGTIVVGTSARGGNGGNGKYNDISGTGKYYAGGGGGGAGDYRGTAYDSIGGIGGGGAGSSGNGVDGIANTGGGGGGAGGQGGAGGSGVVIIRYKTADFGTCTGGTITTVGNDTVHTFTSNGIFVSVPKPEVSTQAISNVKITEVTANGTIVDAGGTVTERGFCYKVGTSGDPTTSDSVAYDDGDFGTGAFTKSITGLSPNTSYRVRAYAVNSAGTSYGTTVQVTTLKAFKPRTMWF